MHISVKVLYICNIQPQVRILCQFCREIAKHEYCYDYYNMYVLKKWYSDLSRTFRRPFAVFSHCSKKDAHPYLQMSLGYKKSCMVFWTTPIYACIWVYMHTYSIGFCFTPQTCHMAFWIMLFPLETIGMDGTSTPWWNLHQQQPANSEEMLPSGELTKRFNYED